MRTVRKRDEATVGMRVYFVGENGYAHMESSEDVVHANITSSNFNTKSENSKSFVDQTVYPI